MSQLLLITKIVARKYARINGLRVVIAVSAFSGETRLLTMELTVGVDFFKEQWATSSPGSEHEEGKASYIQDSRMGWVHRKSAGQSMLL
jgi:hypothetical protein